MEVKNMSCFNCKCNCNCALAAIIASVIIGVVAAFLQITGVIEILPVFLWVVLGISVVYLAVITVSSSIAGGYDGCGCKCSILSVVIAGILGSILFSVILLAVGVTAGSVVSAILVGLLLLSFSLLIAGTACYARCLADCGE
jgi:hypothetical protein